MGQIFLETKDFTKNVRVKKYLDGYCLVRDEESVYLGKVYTDTQCIVSDLTKIEIHDLLTNKFLYSQTSAHHMIKNALLTC